jgi:hypothetical protein
MSVIVILSKMLIYIIDLLKMKMDISNQAVVVLVVIAGLDWLLLVLEMDL